MHLKHHFTSLRRSPRGWRRPVPSAAPPNRAPRAVRSTEVEREAVGRPIQALAFPVGIEKELTDGFQ